MRTSVRKSVVKLWLISFPKITWPNVINTKLLLFRFFLFDFFYRKKIRIQYFDLKRRPKDKEKKKVLADKSDDYSQLF